MKILSELSDADRERSAHLRSPSGRPAGKLRRSRPRRWIALVVVLVLLVPTVVSYGQALTGPGNDKLSIRSTEWLRSHHFRWLVNDVESWWYTHHQPKKGGVLSAADRARLGGSARPVSRAAPIVAAPSVLPDPPAMVPFEASPLPGEGQWRLLSTVNGKPAIEVARLAPDAVHTSLLASVVWIDPKVVKTVGYAGVTEPGGIWTNQAPIPDALRPSLVAAFNSGFKMADAQGGYYADGHEARPLVAGQATAWIDTNGTLNVGQWGRDVSMGPNVVFARQNLALIVDGGQPVPDVLSGNSAKWGLTVGNKVLVWRSGLGVTADGGIVYAASNGLSALTLAQLLARAGAVRAMELDINSAWTCFFTYAPAPAGAPAADLTVTKLDSSMQPSEHNYLTASSRDFFALFGR